MHAVAVCSSRTVKRHLEIHQPSPRPHIHPSLGWTPCRPRTRCLARPSLWQGSCMPSRLCGRRRKRYLTADGISGAISGAGTLCH